MTDWQAIPIKTQVARRFAERALGLIVQPVPLPGHGLLFERCSAVHTWFMRQAIDVVFLDADRRVLRVAAGVAPWRFVRCARAVQVLEMRSGECARLGVMRGSLLRWM